ncbi:TetR/AcrR family transcriptional regulator [Xanthovirga aplysinae]|uniref:TetR/AcrR family transcriptional regulator n=1 Tax=Xanthovirga aplysinae TaxID=2529853 RepID=UPI0012BCEE03|nr:TetR/AcrR family transcriptional regulator [Xanthovirga aplysinae]MTI31713.1 TetR/AcrR family transcriptional regulator [Xanthovirga aplysinae]
MPRKKNYDIDEVLEKAMKTFWQNGYEATSIRTLEKEMGINQFSIYSSFKSKHGVFIEALKKYNFFVKENFLNILIKSEGHLSDIRTFFNQFIDNVKSEEATNGCLMANSAMELGSKDRDTLIQLQGFYDFLQETFMILLEKAKKRNEIGQEADLKKYANYLVGCSQSLAVTAKILDKEKLDDFVEMSLKSIV